MLLLLVGLAVLGLYVAIALALLSPASSGKRLTLDQLQSAAVARQVSAVTVHTEDDRITGTLTAPKGAGFWVAFPDAATGQVLSTLSSAGVRVSVDQQSGKRNVRFLLEYLVPPLVLADLFGLLMLATRGGSSVDEVTAFGAMDDGVRSERNKVRFADVGGCPEALEELAEVCDYLKNPRRYEMLGATAPKGVLLFGAPGTGKTLLARAVAGEAAVPFFSVAGAQFVESLVGVGAARVRDLFRRVRAAAPAIVFIDELDAVARRRQAGGGSGGTDEREQTLNQLLVEIDGFDAGSGIVVIAASNRPDILDPALMRPGRFDRHITIDPPDREGRKRILAIHMRKKRLAGDVDLDRLAGRTPGFTGADLANVVNEAALLASRQRLSTVGNAQLQEAMYRVLSGPQRRGHLMDERERRWVATHEMGHALVAARLGLAGDVHRVSLLGRSRSLATTGVADGDGALVSASQLRRRLVITLAGMAAEQVVHGETSTAVETDLADATRLARDLVTRYGASPILGPVRLLEPAGTNYLGHDVELAPIAPETQRMVDEEIRRLVDEALAEATALVVGSRDHLDRLVDLLIEHETLEEDELATALAPLTRVDGKAARTTAGPRRRAARQPAPDPAS
jgi:cell division protease FtsH